MNAAAFEGLVSNCPRTVVVRNFDVCCVRLADAHSDKERWIGAVSVTEIQFAQAVLASVPDGATLDAYLLSLPEALPLVAGCAAGDSRAIREFEQRYFRALRPALRRMKLDDDAIAEVRQLVRQKLFVVAAGGVSPLFQYVGKGDLANFVRVVATRTAISLLRKKSPTPASDSDALLGAHSPADSPQMRLLKAKHATEFKRAFETAMADLTPQDRNILRMSFVANLSIDEIGTFYSIHRATAARRLARARARLADITRQELRRDLDLSEGEFSSILRLVQSQLDLSITRVLGD